MPKKNYRSNNTYLIEGNSGDNPKLMGQSLSDGRDSLYLEFYLGYDVVESKEGKIYKKAKRSTDRLGLYLWQAPRSPMERQQNKETLELAKRIRFERGQELLENAEGYRLKKDRDANLLEWMERYHGEYTKKDRRVIRQAINCFYGFLESDRRYAKFRPRMKPGQLTKEIVAAFAAYLMDNFNGETPHTILARFKKIIRAAEAADLIIKDPCAGVSIRVDQGSLKKDILSIEEVQALIRTHCPGENTDIRRAFIFCLYTGLRWCDVKDLRYADVDFSNRSLRFEQSKTKGHSAASAVAIPLNSGLINLIGNGGREDLIFPLPSHSMCLKALRRWCARAGIDKHITWHCARHSFATNILSRGANIKTVASLLGHSDLRHTEKYVRAVDSLKEAAINSLPELNL